MKLTGKTALVTGASRGIGHGIAALLADEGAFVVGTATGESGIKQIDALLAVGQRKGLALQLDAGSDGSLDSLIAALADRSLVIDILVNNAAITRDNLLLRMKDEEWDDVMQVDLRTVFRLSRVCLRAMMKARAGRIINITSVVGVRGNAGQCNYAAAKAGLIGFTKSLAREVGSRGITVNAVAPGFIETDMTRALGDPQRDAILAEIPLNRFGSVAEVASVVAFLASTDAAYISGETLHVNGGMYMS